MPSVTPTASAPSTQSMNDGERVSSVDRLSAALAWCQRRERERMIPRTPPNQSVPPLILLPDNTRAQQKSKRAQLRAKYRQQHRQTFLAERARWMSRNHRRKHTELRQKLLEVLGGKCVCCGESAPRFLTLDHIAGGGRYHRSTRPKTYQVYKDVLTDPSARDKYRLLCWNCNCATRGGVVCPHNQAEVDAFLEMCQTMTHV